MIEEAESIRMYIVNAVTRLLRENNRISAPESGFPLSESNLLFYCTHLSNSKSRMKKEYTAKTIEKYIIYLKQYHRENNMSLVAFSSRKFLNFELSYYTSFLER